MISTILGASFKNKTRKYVLFHRKKLFRMKASHDVIAHNYSYFIPFVHANETKIINRVVVKSPSFPPTFLLQFIR